MPSYRKDTNALQVADYASLIWNLNMAIVESNVYHNYQAIPALVTNLEQLLTPYFDESYREDIEKIRAIKAQSGRTPADDRANYAEAEAKAIDLKYRALLTLAYRKGFLPASRGGQSVDFDMRDFDE